MNTLIKNFEKDIDSYFKKFLNHLSNKYNLSDISNEWESFCQNGIQQSPSIVVSHTKNTCTYVFIKGQNEGKHCPNIIVPGLAFCKSHIKHEENGQKEKKIIPKIQEKNTKQILMLLKGTNYWWHQDSRLVFISPNEKTVIARHVDGDLQKLGEKEIELCKKYRFNYDENYNFNKIEKNSGGDISTSESSSNKKNMSERFLNKSRALFFQKKSF